MSRREEFIEGVVDTYWHLYDELVEAAVFIVAAVAVLLVFAVAFGPAALIVYALIGAPDPISTWDLAISGGVLVAWTGVILVPVWNGIERAYFTDGGSE